jgi:hypothetical protein
MKLQQSKEVYPLIIKNGGVCWNRKVTLEEMELVGRFFKGTIEFRLNQGDCDAGDRDSTTQEQ